ncbi:MULTISPECIES: hypothetical protein [Metallosphaera]|uniref:Uncharacterized protein n=1 Tax=Metallosphaera cuprina (strain Ar-4) TaxID=1006006 RepID=F4G2S2_METCR|nr:hypothetical protein [Metallosphaera cuprina]AEB95120.1 conserved hypothetical protein [Metallosphaera cuprina Ar-4]
MGRTIPSYTASIDSFISVLERISKRTGSLEEVIEETKRRIRYFQNESYDEDIDPQTLVILTMISVIEDECKRNGKAQGGRNQ